MSSISVTTMSSKGQIVIPSDMRTGLKEGVKLVIIRDGDRFIIKRASDFDKNLEEDLRFAESVEDAWKRYDRGEFRQLPAKDFLKELEKW